MLALGFLLLIGTTLIADGACAVRSSEGLQWGMRTLSRGQG